MESVVRIFPMHLREKVKKALVSCKDPEEIRIRIGQPVTLGSREKERYLSDENVDGALTEDVKEAYRADGEDLLEMVTFLSRYSRYAFREEIRNGFLTLEGGHRVGVAGQVRMEAGKVEDIVHIQFLNIRIASEKKGCAGELLGHLREEGGLIYNTLFFSAPGVGKTTYLRDCVRLISDECHLTVSLIDERSEIAACYMGVPQKEVGMRTDVLDGVSKKVGMQMMIRSMAPNVIAVDELGGAADYQALTQALYCGCRILGTVHAQSMEELLAKEEFRLWKKSGIFKRYVCLRKEKTGERCFEIYDGKCERLC